MTNAYGLGPFPGTSLSEAADVIFSETGDRPHLPQLPARGLGSDAVGRTAALLGEMITVDRGPRSWIMTPRPQLLTRASWDRIERDLDELEGMWGSRPIRLKTQVVGPWTLAADVELSNGHRVLTDRGALHDVTEALIEGVNAHVADLAQRFGLRPEQIDVQIDEPRLSTVIAGRLPGTSELDEIRAVHPKDAGERLAHVVERLTAGHTLLNLTGQEGDWEAAALSGADTVQLTLGKVRGTADLDAFGQLLTAGQRVGVGLTAAGDEIDELGEAPRAKAVAVAKFFDELGLPRQLLTTAVDVHPTETDALVEADVLSAAGAYRMAAAVAGMLERDAGDL